MVNQLRIIVDADACPKACLAIVQRLAKTYSCELLTVASFNHRIPHEQHVVVGDEPQATDMAVVNLTQPMDVVVTQDLGLAGIVLAKKARVITPHGRILEADQMDFLLEERAVLARFRRHGGRTKGPARRTGEDDRCFELNMKKLLDQSHDLDGSVPVALDTSSEER